MNRPSVTAWAWILSLLTAAAASALASVALAATDSGQSLALPARLSETGLYLPGTTRVRPDIVPYSPQYPLWSDGASKRRWLYLPAGSAIDARNPAQWEFPVGTRVWKEFAHQHAVETRFIERLGDGSWRYASYVWNAKGSDADLAPSRGIRALQAPGAPDDRYDIPSQDDCRACHEGGATPMLGISALQLSPLRDPDAPHAESTDSEQIDLEGLVQRGLLINLPAQMLQHPPQIPALGSTARSALGYLHANCGHCHNEQGPLAERGPLLSQAGADLASVQKTLRSTIDHAAETRAFGLKLRAATGEVELSQLVARMRSRHPNTQMPPLGTRQVDDIGLALVEHWIKTLPTPQETSP